MSQPLVSVIIPTKNAASLFRKVLAQVCAQQTDFEFEILIIDSGSSDGTVEWVKAQAALDSRIRLYSIAPQDFGHGKTRNLGVSLSRGEYAAFLTHDALPVNDRWLTKLLQPMREDEKVAGVFGRHKAYATSNPITRKEIEDHFNLVNAVPVIELDDKVRYQKDQNYRQFLHFYSDNNSMLRKSVWEKIPYPEVDFAEDQAWAKLILETGYRKAYANEASVFHSHDYTAIETCRRAFDESRALRNLFGYRLCPYFFQLILRSGKKTLKDWKHLSAIHSLKDFWLKVLILNVAKIFGFYLGSNEFYSKGYGKRLSLDESLKKAKND